MANFTAKDVNELRKSTGAGLMDCKRALTEAEGDTEKAIVLLREKGLATQAKKAGRVAAEGIVLAATNEDNSVGVIVEVNSETDFAAGTDTFKAFVDDVAKTIIAENPTDVEDLKTKTIPSKGVTVDEAFQSTFLEIRENLQIRRFVRMEGLVVGYTHSDRKKASIVNMKSSIGVTDLLKEVGKDCAMQAVAMKPSYFDESDVPASVIESEKAIMLEQVNNDPKMASKPDKVKENIINGKVKKYYSENCLVDQEFVKDSSFTIKSYVADAAKKLNADVSLVGFARYECGEGIEKKEDNFADEVSSMIK